MRIIKFPSRVIVVALGLALITPSAFSNPTNNLITAQSKITAATVFTDRAIVTRTAPVNLPAGESLIILEKLPFTLVDNSVQVSGRGSASVSILDVTTKTTYVTNRAEVDQPRVSALRAEIEAVEQTIANINERKNVLDGQSRLIGKIEDAIAAPPGNNANIRPSMDDLQKMMTFSVDARTKLIDDRQKLATEEKQANDKRQALHDQLNAITGGAGESRIYKTVTVRVAADKAGSLDLTADYTVTGASWTPSYDARLRSEERVVELSYYGNVRQATGEDWNNVALTLSTAKPSLGGAAPVLSPWIVDMLVVQPIKAAGELRSGYGGRAEDKSAAINGQAFNNLQALASAPAASPAPPMEEAKPAVATVDNNATSASFKIAAITSIPSDNTPQKVSITTTKLPAKLQYQAIPKMMETAFLSAYVANATDFPLLAGAVNNFLDNAFVSTSALKTVMPSEKFEISLGADEGVAIKRRVVNRFTENTGLMGRGRRVTYEFLITITNNKKTAERVVFKEALPLSRNEKIVVNLLAPAAKEVGTLENPGKEVTREEDNKLVWRLDLKPGEKREIPLKFSVEYPGDIQVTGLE